MMKDRVLVTGGHGYLGGRIVRYLSERGWTVRAGSRRLEPVACDPGVAVEAALTDYASPESLVAACRGCDAVVHLAAPNEIESAGHPERALVGTAVHTLRLVDAAVAAGVRRFIYFSTAHVYGVQTGRIDETMPLRSTHPYGIAHGAAESWVLAAQAQGGLSGIVVRLSNGFGAPLHPRISRWTLLVNDLCRQAIERRSLTLRSDGGDWRNFIPLADVERLVEHLLGLPDDRVGDGLLNAGSARSLRIIDMAELVAARCEQVLHYRPAVSAAAPTVRDHPALDYRIDRLLATGFVPAADFEVEIDRTLRACAEWFAPAGGGAP